MLLELYKIKEKDIAEPASEDSAWQLAAGFMRSGWFMRLMLQAVSPSHALYVGVTNQNRTNGSGWS